MIANKPQKTTFADKNTAVDMGGDVRVNHGVNIAVYDPLPH